MKHLALALLATTFMSHADPAKKPNVLLILVDDLKPAIAAFGDTHAVTPNLDKLTNMGMRFDKAYCNQAVCAPSRFTLMLGSHSSATGLYDLGNNLRNKLPDAITLPQYFSKHGYRTESLGKIFHIGHGNHGDPESFSVPHFKEKVVEYVLPESTDGGQLTIEEAFFSNKGINDDQGNRRPRGAAFESPDVPDEAYADGRVAAEAIKRLESAAGHKEPFFMAVGFARPHLPFCAPKKYWDLYDPESLPRPESETMPKAAPVFAGKSPMSEIGNYKPTSPQLLRDKDYAKQLVHGYYASTSYMDAQVGKVMEALENLKLADETIIVLWGDHGFHLGELGFWTKHVNYERANRIPIVIVAPGVTKPGSHTDQLAETVDIFPTLAELAGLPAPEVPQPISGLSLVPVLKNPEARVRDHAYHCFPRQQGLGRAIRTDRYRLVEWKPIGEPNKKPFYELYDYSESEVELKNIAGERPETIKKLADILSGYPKPVK